MDHTLSSNSEGSLPNAVQVTEDSSFNRHFLRLFLRYSGAERVKRERTLMRFRLDSSFLLIDCSQTSYPIMNPLKLLQW